MTLHGARYMENAVLAADALGLVRLLYEGAIEALLRARSLLQERKIAERSGAISKAMEIILELQGSLDFERGGEIASALAQLYAYIQNRLAAANAQQVQAPLDEALQLLMVLYEGWKDISLAPPALPAEARAGDEALCRTL